MKSDTIDTAETLPASEAEALGAPTTLATAPAKTKIQGVVANITTTFACTATCVSTTLSLDVGKTAGGAEYLASFDADAATGWFGTTLATTGTALLVANAAQAGDYPNVGGTNAITLRLTSGTGAVGTGAATNLSQGSVTVYITSTVLP